MLLTRYTDGSVRVLIYAALDPDTVVTIDEIARHCRMSRNHLKKIVPRLAQHGYIRTARGRGGGMSLASPAKSINLGNIVRDMEPTLEIMDCNKPPCPIAGSCTFKQALMEARHCFLKALDRYTLADLVKNKNVLQQLMGKESVYSASDVSGRSKHPTLNGA